MEPKLVDKLQGIVDGYYADSDYFQELAAILEHYEAHKNDLNMTAVLWVAAIDLLPIEERIEWVAKISKQVDEFNKIRAREP